MKPFLPLLKAPILTQHYTLIKLTEALSEGLIPKSLELEWNILKLPEPEAGLKITC